MCGMPSTARVMNHSTITGPKARPMSSVPNRWIENSSTMIVSASGRIHLCTEGAAICRPSTDDSTEMAGVMMLSP